MAHGSINVGMRCIKYMLLTACLMFVLTSALIISVGTTIYAIHHDFSYFLEARYVTPASLIVILGVFMLIISLFGALGALKESTCLVNMFAFLLSLVFILSISAAIATYKMRNNVGEIIENTWRNSLHLYADDQEVKASVDFVQAHLQCCGVDSYSDWGSVDNLSEGIQVFNMTVPDSCCAGTESSLIDGVTTAVCVELYASGCLLRVVYLIRQSSSLLATGAMTISFILLVGIIFSSMLAKAIRKAKTEREVRRWQICEQMINSQRLTSPIEKKSDNVTYVPENTI